MRIASRIPALAGLVALALVPSLPARGEDKPEEKKLGWLDSAELSYVMTGGNSDTSTLGFKNKTQRVWEDSRLEFNVAGIRAKSSQVDAYALGTPSDFEVKDGPSETTAESYLINGRYDRNITKHFFWYVGAGWDRNIPSGVQNRYIGTAGVGNTWVDNDSVKFRTDYALTYTKQEDVVENPDVNDKFAGFRFSWAYWNKFGESTVYTNDFIVDENFDESSDYRGDMTNAVAVTMNKHLALKVSLRLLYDHEPALKEVPIFDPGDYASGTLTQTGTALVELDTLDTIFTTSLVVNF